MFSLIYLIHAGALSFALLLAAVAQSAAVVASAVAAVVVAVVAVVAMVTPARVIPRVLFSGKAGRTGALPTRSLPTKCSSSR